MPTKIQEVTTSRKLIKKFALVGQISPQLDETIVPVVVLDDLSDSEDWKYAMQGDGRGAGGVGTFNTWSLENPAGSGHLVQCLHFSYCTQTSQIWVVHHNNTTPTLGTPLGGQYQDLRGMYVVPNTYPVGEFRTEELAAGLGAVRVREARILGNTIDVWEPERLLIYPGQEIFFQGLTDNTTGRVGCRWRERPLRPDGD